MDRLLVFLVVLLWYVGTLIFYIAWRSSHPDQKFDWGFFLAPFWWLAVFIWLLIRWIYRERRAIQP